MKLHVIAVGARMPDWIQAGWNDYAKRLPADCPLLLHEVRPEPRTTGKTTAQMMAAEARRIEAAIPAGALTVALDERGKDLSTMALAERMQRWRDDGRDVAFLIGGPDGMDVGLKQGCDERVRLSSLTLPHAMVRVLLAEQLYRGWAILANHPYHRP